ncbi:MAG TPA: methyltransferase domain-containing protein [Terriglobia bacterium]|nr:methyltransferase domain-containing protein [Terriglobia bacterium]
MAGISNSKFALRQHLIHLGYAFGARPEVVTEKLNAHLGPERVKQYSELVADPTLTGEARENAIYDFFNDLTEANLLRSLSTDVTLDTCYFLYEKALAHFGSGTRILELACWTGGFSSFIAEQHPDCIVTGVDRASKVVEICRALYRCPNLSFAEWDYRNAKPSSIEPADVLLCSLGTNYDCPRDAYAQFESSSVRSTTGYVREMAEASRYFKSWREAAKPGATLLAVLRTFTFPRFLAFIDAAQEAGWTPLLNDFTTVECAGNNENIPFLAFNAESAARVDEDLALSQFTRMMNKTDRWGTLNGPTALGIYRSLGNRHVLATKEALDPSGRRIVEELGICGSLGYLYRHDGFPNVDLTLLSRSLAEDLFTKSTMPGGGPAGVVVDGTQNPQVSASPTL